MNQPHPPTQIDLTRQEDFDLGAAVVRPALSLFVANGVEIQVQPRVMQVLVALGQRSGKVVSREALVQACWSGRVVGDDAIQRAIAKARALGEQSGAFTIEAIARVGYRLAVALTCTATPSAEPVLAILAFDNLSSDPEMSAFSDGISDEILQTLARATRLKVIGRASSFQFRGADKAVRKVAAELGASHVLDGSVRRGGDRVRIGAQLIEAEGQTTIWSNTFDRSARDLLALQDEIAAAVAGALNCKFARVPMAAAISPEVYEQFLRAREAVRNYNFGPAQIEALDEITRRAPDFAPGWALAAFARRRSLDLGERFATRTLAEGKAAADRACVLDPENPYSLYARVSFEPWCNRWTEVELQLRKGLTNAPHDPQLMAMLAGLLLETGRLTEALEFNRGVFELDRLHASAANNYAVTLHALGREEEAFAILEDACRRWPFALFPLHSVVVMGALSRRWDIVDRWLTLESHPMSPPEHPLVHDMISVAQTFRDPAPERIERMVESLRPGLDNLGRFGLARLGFAAAFCDLNRIYELVERASFAHMFELGTVFQHRSDTFWMMQIFTRFTARFQSDVRFVSLCARLGFPQHWLETDRWPDCVDHVPYDFRGECARVAANPPPP